MRITGLPPRLFVCIVSAIAGIAHGSTGRMHIEAPSDQELIALYQEHRSEFDRLRELATEDMRIQSYFNEATIDRIAPVSRRLEYQRLLRLRAGLAVGVDYNGNVRFIFATRGSAVSHSWAEGIQYSTPVSRLPGKPVATTDSAMSLPEGIYLRELAPHWFILFQKDN
jgi:hypothetical protein